MFTKKEFCGDEYIGKGIVSIQEKKMIKDKSIFRHEFEGFSIDNPSAKELDDGLFVTKTSYGYDVFVSVSDVSEFVDIGSELDNQAFLKGRKFHGVNMFPVDYVKNVLTLSKGKTSFTITIKLELDKDFNTLSFNIFESKFLNIDAFNYNSYDNFLYNKSYKYQKDLQHLFDVARGIKEKIFVKNGVKTSDLIKQSSSMENNAEGVGSFINTQILTLVNIELAKFVIKNKIDIIFRNHTPHFNLDGMSVNKNPYYSSEMYYHFGLNTSPYTHFTSPIRRYPDVVNARQIKSHLRLKTHSYSKKELELISNLINSRIEKVLLNNND